ncbi:MAG: GntR family transcriptional regulator, partial [Clostridiales bacterium]|nr:GntR family transcriptional regulator [Clostridiales bacterium]
EQMYRYRVEYLKEEEIRSSLVQEHDALWDKLKHRDLEGAKKVTQGHIERQQAYILDTIYGQNEKK